MTGQRTVSDAYFHLSYQRVLQRWLGDQGYAAKIEHTFSNAGGRADLYVVVEGVSHSLEVQLSPLTPSRWAERDTRYAGHVDRVTWLHGPGCDAVLATDRLAQGVALGIRTHEDRVQIGASWQHEHTMWSDLTACRMTSEGFWTPDLEDAHAQADALQREREREQERQLEQERELERERLDTEQREHEARAVEVARRKREADEAHSNRRLAELEAEHHRAASRQSQPPTLSPPPPATQYVTLARRTFAGWARLHPEGAQGLHGPTPRWLEDFDPVERQAGHWIAYLVSTLYSRGLIEDLRHPEINESSFVALCDALFTAGLACLDPDSELGRWARPTA